MTKYYEPTDYDAIYFEHDICERFTKFLSIIESITYKQNNAEIHIGVCDDGFSIGDFTVVLKDGTISFLASANKDGYTLSFKKIVGVTGEFKAKDLINIILWSKNFSTTIKKPRYEVFESVMRTFCEAMNIKFTYSLFRTIGH